MKTGNIARRLRSFMGAVVTALILQGIVQAIAHIPENKQTQEIVIFSMSGMAGLCFIGYLLGTVYQHWYTTYLFDEEHNKDTPVFVLFIRFLFLWAFTIPYMLYYETMTLFGESPPDESSPGRVSIDDM